MKSSNYMDVVPTSNPLVAAIVDKENGMLVAEYRISPYATYMQNAELASLIIEAYEKYYEQIHKGGKP
jgi:hypothetical protein